MPYVSVRTTEKVSTEQMNLLQNKIGEYISLIPGKDISRTMTEIESECNLYMAGKESNAVFCDVRLFGVAPLESKRALAAKFNELFSKELGTEQLYLNFVELTEWGDNDKYIAE